MVHHSWKPGLEPTRQQNELSPREKNRCRYSSISLPSVSTIAGYLITFTINNQYIKMMFITLVSLISLLLILLPAVSARSIPSNLQSFYSTVKVSEDQWLITHHTRDFDSIINPGLSLLTGVKTNREKPATTPWKAATKTAMETVWTLHPYNPGALHA